MFRDSRVEKKRLFLNWLSSAYKNTDKKERNWRLEILKEAISVDT